MTRHPQRRLALALAVAAALSGPAWAQTAEAPVAAPGATTAVPFVVGDIRVDGLQRIGAGISLQVCFAGKVNAGVHKKTYPRCSRGPYPLRHCRCDRRQSSPVGAGSDEAHTASRIRSIHEKDTCLKSLAPWH